MVDSHELPLDGATAPDFARLFEAMPHPYLILEANADFTIVDLKRQETITNKWIKSRCGWTPYDGVRVTGWPVGTFIRGKRVMWQGEIAAEATGAPVRFMEA
mgnify:CR=1 FL=1